MSSNTSSLVGLTVAAAGDQKGPEVTKKELLTRNQSIALLIVGLSLLAFGIMLLASPETFGKPLGLSDYVHSLGGWQWSLSNAGFSVSVLSLTFGGAGAVIGGLGLNAHNKKLKELEARNSVMHT